MSIFTSFNVNASGMKGTYIKVLKDMVFEEVEKLKRENIH